MEKINYTNAMYQEDLRLVNSIYNKYFNRYKNEKEDLIAEGLATAWQSRCAFNGLSKYSTFCYNNVFNRLFDIVTKNHTYSSDDVLFSEKASEDDKNTLGDLLEDKSFNFDDVDDFLVIQKTLISYLKELSKPNKIYKITLMIIKGYSSSEIAEKNNCSISYVNRVKQEFKNKLKFLIKKELHDVK